MKKFSVSNYILHLFQIWSDMKSYQNGQQKISIYFIWPNTIRMHAIDHHSLIVLNGLTIFIVPGHMAETLHQQSSFS